MREHIEADGGIQAVFWKLDVVQKGRVTTTEHDCPLLIEGWRRDEWGDWGNVAATPLEYRGLEYGGVTGREVRARRRGRGAGWVRAPRCLEMRGRGCGTVTWAEIVWGCPSFHSFDFPFFLLSWRLWRGGVAVVDGLRPVSATGSTGFRIKIDRPPAALPRALILYFIEPTVQ